MSHEAFTAVFGPGRASNRGLGRVPGTGIRIKDLGYVELIGFAQVVFAESATPLDVMLREFESPAEARAFVELLGGERGRSAD
jgi:hypothetical protein